MTQQTRMETPSRSRWRVPRTSTSAVRRPFAQRLFRPNSVAVLMSSIFTTDKEACPIGKGQPRISTYETPSPFIIGLITTALTASTSPPNTRCSEESTLKVLKNKPTRKHGQGQSRFESLFSNAKNSRPKNHQKCILSDQNFAIAKDIAI